MMPSRAAVLKIVSFGSTSTRIEYELERLLLLILSSSRRHYRGRCISKVEARSCASIDIKERRHDRKQTG